MCYHIDISEVVMIAEIRHLLQINFPLLTKLVTTVS